MVWVRAGVWQNMNSLEWIRLDLWGPIWCLFCTTTITITTTIFAAAAVVVEKYHSPFKCLEGLDDIFNVEPEKMDLWDKSFIHKLFTSYSKRGSILDVTNQQEKEECTWCHSPTIRGVDMIYSTLTLNLLGHGFRFPLKMVVKFLVMCRLLPSTVTDLSDGNGPEWWCAMVSDLSNGASC